MPGHGLCTAPHALSCHAFGLRSSPYHTVPHDTPCYLSDRIIPQSSSVSFLTSLPKHITLRGIGLDPHDPWASLDPGAKPKMHTAGAALSTRGRVSFFLSRHSMGWWQLYRGGPVLCGHRFAFIKHILVRIPNSSFSFSLWIIPGWGKSPF